MGCGAVCCISSSGTYILPWKARYTQRYQARESFRWCTGNNQNSLISSFTFVNCWDRDLPCGNWINVDSFCFRENLRLRTLVGQCTHSTAGEPCVALLIIFHLRWVCTSNVLWTLLFLELLFIDSQFYLLSNVGPKMLLFIKYILGL